MSANASDVRGNLLNLSTIFTIIPCLKLLAIYSEHYDYLHHHSDVSRPSPSSKVLLVFCLRVICRSFHCCLLSERLPSSTPGLGHAAANSCWIQTVVYKPLDHPSPYHVNGDDTAHST